MDSKRSNPSGRTITVGIVVAGILIGAGITAFERSATWARFYAGFAVREYLNTHPLRKVQIGAGGQDLPGWLNTDITPGPKETYLDATARFPFPDGSIHFIYAEHVIEHLSYEDGLRMLRECYRVLAPGGKVRIATPNLLKLVGLFQEDKTGETKNYMRAKTIWHDWPDTSSPACIIINLEFREFGHQFIYDPDTLGNSMIAAKFRNVQVFPPGQSDSPELTGIESREQGSDMIRIANEYESMVLQAVK